MEELLKITDLTVQTSDDQRVLVNQISLSLREGEAVGVVGESGSGKTLTALSILGLLARGLEVGSGSIEFAGADLLKVPAERLRAIRGNEIAMVYQDPMTALNPVMRLGDQLREVLSAHDLADATADERVRASFASVGIPDPDRAMRSYPHEFSGGMRQRVMIAMALLLSPKLLIADEPTTALDVTIQRQILALVAKERRQRKMSMLWITHDLGVVANLVDRVVVMYAGRIVESGKVSEIFNSPRHPYTAGLLASLPSSDHARGRLASIPGVPPKPWQVGGTCAFAPRCEFATERCRSERPLLEGAVDRQVACFYPIGAK